MGGFVGFVIGGHFGLSGSVFISHLLVLTLYVALFFEHIFLQVNDFPNLVSKLCILFLRTILYLLTNVKIFDIY